MLIITIIIYNEASTRRLVLGMVVCCFHNSVVLFSCTYCSRTTYYFFIFTESLKIPIKISTSKNSHLNSRNLLVNTLNLDYRLQHSHDTHNLNNFNYQTTWISYTRQAHVKYQKFFALQNTLAYSWISN